MKTLLLFILLFAFLQSAFLPINMVLVLIVARSLVTDGRENLYLAFFGGLILSFLTQINLGYYSLVFILIVKLAMMIKKLPISFNFLVTFVAGALLVILASIADSLFISQPVEFTSLLVEALLVVPCYFLIKIWEERFVATPHTKLKIGR